MMNLNLLSKVVSKGCTYHHVLHWACDRQCKCTVLIEILAAKRAMIYQAQYALRKHLRDEMPGYDDLSDDDRDIQMNDFDSEYV